MKHSRIVAAVLTASLGCASPRAHELKPLSLPNAKLVSRPTLDLSARNLRGLQSAKVKYEVVIRTDGSPDMATLRITGNGASQLRDAITEFIGAGTFEAAKQNGVPVLSMFRGGLEARRR